MYGKIGLQDYIWNVHENIVYIMIAIFTILGQKTAELNDYHILLTMLYIFLSEFGLNSRNLTLHPRDCYPLDTRSYLKYQLHVRI